MEFTENPPMREIVSAVIEKWGKKIEKTGASGRINLPEAPCIRGIMSFNNGR